METENCLHEEMIEYGITVYQDATLHVVQVRCSGCGAFGTVVEHWDDDSNDFEYESETWHDIGTYRNMIEA